MGLLSLYDQLTPLTILPNRQPTGLLDYGYGNRWDEAKQSYSGPPKGNGFLGVIQSPDDWQSYSSEIGIGNSNGEHPTMVPGLNHNEIVQMLTGNREIPNSVYDKADSYQSYRRLLGKDSWLTPYDKQEIVPLPIPETSLLPYFSQPIVRGY